MLGSPSASPPAKRVKLPDIEDEGTSNAHEGSQEHDEESETSCSICLQEMEDRTVIPTCSHEFCFDCLTIWTAQSRRCPLCTQTIGEYVIHDIRSRFDYRKHHLAPLRSSSPQLLLPPQTTAAIQARNAARRMRRDRQRERERRNDTDERDKLDLSIATRRWVYKHDLYAKHVASNSFTKYRPHPTPAQFATSSELISRTTTFLRRELQVWQGLDIEFLTNLIISLMKAIDIRSESAVKLLAEFLDMDVQYEPGQRHVNAEHFAHEVYSYVRSPYRDLFVYDSVVQYNRPPNASPPPQARQPSSRWQEGQISPERRLSRSPPRSPVPAEGPSPERLDTFNRQGRSRRPEVRAIRHHVGDDHDRQPDLSGVRSASAIRRNNDDFIRHDVSSSTASTIDTYASHSRKGKEKEDIVTPDCGARQVTHPRRNNERLISGKMQSWSSMDDRSTADLAQETNMFSPAIPEAVSETKVNQPGLTMDPAILDLGDSNPPVHGPKKRLTARDRPPRQKSLLDSVRTHLSLDMQAPEVPPSHRHGPQTHMPSGKGSHCPSQRPSLFDRLSDPVTTLADMTDEQVPTQRHATDSHQAIEDNDGVIALGHEIIRHLASNMSHTDNETSKELRDHHHWTSGLESSTPLTQQQPSSLPDGHQDDSGQAVDANRRVMTATSSASQFELKLADAPISTLSDETSKISTSKSPSSAQASTAPHAHINSVQKEAYQTHVGLTPPAISTHGPRVSAPITIPQGANSTAIHSDFRAKLLSRLGEERTQMNEAWNSENRNVKEVQLQRDDSLVNVDGSFPTSETDRNPPKHDTGADRSKRRSMWDCRDPTYGKRRDSDPLNTIMDAAVLESRLRTRVRLRTKLEEEKRIGDSQ